MIMQNDLSQAAQMRAELAKCLEERLGDPTCTWPRLPIPSRPVADSRPRLGLRVLVIGELTLDLPIKVATTKAGLEALLNGESENRLPWSMSRAQVGGFVAHAGRAAAALGADVSVCTVVPAPLPASIQRFFDECAVDTRLVRALPGPCPVVIRAKCVDGELRIRRRGVLAAAGPELSAAVLGRFDVILVDPAACRDRRGLLGMILKPLRRAPKAPRVGLRASSDWSSGDFGLSRDPHVWTFIRNADGRRLVHSGGGPEEQANDDAIVRQLRHQFGITKLVMHAGARGAMLLNGTPDPCQVRTCPVGENGSAGAGDTLLAITTLSSALGAGDQTSLRRGVDAATGYVAGLELPVGMAELDAGAL